MSIETEMLYREIEAWKKAGRKWMIDSPQILLEFLEHNDDVLRDLVKKESELNELKSKPKCTVDIDWGNLRHDEELDRLLEPHHPIGKEFARNAEKALFTFMYKLKIWKVYIWDDFHGEGSTARWDWCFDYKRPEGKACREHNFANLVAMDDWHFDRLVRSLPKSPNEDIVREWRKEMRKDPLIVQAAKYEATPMDWRDLDLRYDPYLIKKELL